MNISEYSLVNSEILAIGSWLVFLLVFAIAVYWGKVRSIIFATTALILIAATINYGVNHDNTTTALRSDFNNHYGVSFTDEELNRLGVVPETGFDKEVVYNVVEKLVEYEGETVLRQYKVVKDGDFLTLWEETVSDETKQVWEPVKK